ncbi:protein TMEPAI-like isoform X1 [Sinocyclocheilus grahami]|uniref:Prostate transmembrane protein, androgen induced 1 n=1 Tax=Sinocyclocheilus grahami TaxID=75366 RepID=A0A672NYX4_SINGR|nr:PREDICTED: protein TMEPAI-like isoform X1 [Sinocyclocheilus grahami]
MFVRFPREISPMFSFMGLMNGTSDTHTNVSCTCNCKRSTSFQSMAITQLEFVQILVIVVVMMMMVVVITCLLNHYRLSARSLISRHGRAHRRHLPLPSEGSLWCSDGPGSSSAMSEQVYAPRPPDRVRLSRFQPTFPYLSHTIIDLPPTIALSDGEEPPPYQGPCSLQLRDPEQQLELNRESVRAPPNRTVFDGPLISTEGAPPAYSEVIGHYYHPTSVPRHAQTQSTPPLVQGLIHISHTDSRNTRNKDKPKAQLV